MTPKAPATKEKKTEWTPSKLHPEDTIETGKTITETEKTFANHLSDKGLISRIYKIPTCQQQKTTHLKSEQKDLNRLF